MGVTGTRVVLVPAAPVSLVPAAPGDLPAFKAQLQEAFAVAVVEEYGPLRNGPVPADAILDHTLGAPGAAALHIVADGQTVGGAVVSIDEATHRNSLELLFIRLGVDGRGLGRAAWQAIERRYPQTVTWQTFTPYFEKRNIHFYVNVCGFSIVEFFSAHHPDPHWPDDLPGGGEGFRFIKAM